MLKIRLGRSRQLVLSLALTHGAAVACWLGLPLPGWAAACGVATLLASAAWSMARYAWLATPGSLLTLNCEADGVVQITRRDGSGAIARVTGDSFVTPYLTLVHFMLPDGKRTRAILMADALPAELFRQLRVWLKWRAGEGRGKTADGGWATRV
jgi:toxin CptA